MADKEVQKAARKPRAKSEETTKEVPEARVATTNTNGKRTEKRPGGLVIVHS